MDESDARKTRNICILAHVDHGKTTLADHLIASSGGGVLHPKLAGKLRFMDYLDEEQRRAITMKSSSIALQYKDYSINLIDSPGHMDFCSEVSTAARLSDGALVLVDAVEGVHIQTHAVLRQSWIEKLTPCLVINKIDRLIYELKMSPMEAYNRLLRIVHEVNGIVSTYKSEKYLSDVDSLLAGPSEKIGDENLEFIEDDEEDTFQPQKGNVAFTCALDGWGFGISQFAEFWAKNLQVGTAKKLSVDKLQKLLWGPHYLISKDKIVGKKEVANVSNARPMFVQFVLEPLWKIYQAALEDGDKGVVEKLIKKFNLSIPPRELQNKDPKVVVQSVMSHWLPLSDAILLMVVKCTPDPVSAQSFRLSRLLPKRDVLRNEVDLSVLAEADNVRKSVEACDSSHEAPCVAFVSKMFSVPMKMLPQRGSHGEILNNYTEKGESDECFLAFARIFSGVLYSGQRVFVLSALYDPLKSDSMQKHIQEAELHSLYLMMGQGLKPVASAKAGNIVAIRGLGQHILKSATLSSTRNCWPFSSMVFQVSPTLRVAIEPSDPSDMGALMKGLRLLNRADPFVEVTVSSRGENVLAAAGEVHLERCIKDLKERFAKVRLEVSPPLVSYKETIEDETCNALENLKLLSGSLDFVEKTTPNGRCVIRVQVMRLPSMVTKVLDESVDLLGNIFGGHAIKILETQRSSISEDENPVEAFKRRLMGALESHISSGNDNDKDWEEKCRAKWQKFLQRMWALGPGRLGANILFTPDFKRNNTDGSVLVRGSAHVSKRLGFVENSSDGNSNGDTAVESSSEVTQAPTMFTEAESLESTIVSGFRLATAAGPLCDEPMWGLAFIVEAYISPLAGQSDDPESLRQSEQYGIFSGQVMTAVKDACRAAVLQKKPRLVEAMYFCELNTPTEYLGPMYAVLARRRARILKEEMQEGSSLFIVHAYLPVSESFGFADELRRWTSGAASALLVLSHWEELPEDPFFVPKTEEEIEEFGDGSSVLPNTARKLIDAVRRRKGLPVEDKVVQHATKQRTLGRNV
ncbi:hypothetical protein ACOSP7_004840 [Xanthoceras sorbifolium]